MLRLKVFFSVAGIIFTVLALKLQDDRLPWLAIAFLAAAVLVRFLGRPVFKDPAGPSEG